MFISVEKKSFQSRGEWFVRERDDGGNRFILARPSKICRNPPKGKESGPSKQIQAHFIVSSIDETISYNVSIGT